LKLDRLFVSLLLHNFMFALHMRIRLVHKVWSFLLVAVLLLPHGRVCLDENSCSLCSCCTAEHCALSFSAPPCCAFCESAATEATLNDAIAPSELSLQFLRALTLSTCTLVYPSLQFSRLPEQRAAHFAALASQPPLYLRCEVLLI
jgi:hypothetical protein